MNTTFAAVIGPLMLSAREYMDKRRDPIEVKLVKTSDPEVPDGVGLMIAGEWMLSAALPDRPDSTVTLWRVMSFSDVDQLSLDRILDEATPQRFADAVWSILLSTSDSILAPFSRRTARRPATKAEIHAARTIITGLEETDRIGTDDFNVDDDAEAIPVEHGTWISAWLYMARDA